MENIIDISKFILAICLFLIPILIFKKIMSFNHIYSIKNIIFEIIFSIIILFILLNKFNEYFNDIIAHYLKLNQQEFHSYFL
jgi:hypothetical protein